MFYIFLICALTDGKMNIGRNCHILKKAPRDYSYLIVRGSRKEGGDQSAGLAVRQCGDLS